MHTSFPFADHLPFLDFIPLGLVFMDLDSNILMINRFAEDKLLRKKQEVLRHRWIDEFPGLLTEDLTSEPEVYKTIHFTYGQQNFVAQKTPFYRDKEVTGIVLVFQSANTLEEVTKELDIYKNLHSDLKAVFDISYDVIYVADGQGVTLRVSSACERLWGYRESELVGKSVHELEKKGIFRPSVTRMVLEKKDKVSCIQTTKTGRRLMVVGTPIKDEEGRITRVVNASRDITEISELQSELELMKQLTEGYRQELMDLRKQNEAEKKIVYRSEKMKKIITLSQKVAEVDSTVLLLGESGVGKEVVASFIHKYSARKKNPLITVNCGSIPEKLLEDELFGNSERGHSDSAGETRLGLFEMANEGTLFLDEIAEMPLSLQVRLLRVLQEKELVRIGGRSVKVNVRIIASTNRNLEEEVQAGRFREDLYYRLNVVPIPIPPLRERKEDILPLVLHFIEQINKKYGMSKQFGSHVIEKLQSYQWPGNVRELQNVIERLLVTTDETLIGAQHLPEYIASSMSKQKDIQVNQIVPLKKALELVEKDLLDMARKKYGSTTKMAKVLEVNQSTISRKLQQYL